MWLLRQRRRAQAHMALDLEFAVHLLFCVGSPMWGPAEYHCRPALGLSDADVATVVTSCRDKCLEFEAMDPAEQKDGQAVAAKLRFKCTNGGDVQIVVNVMNRMWQDKVKAASQDQVRQGVPLAGIGAYGSGLKLIM